MKIGQIENQKKGYSVCIEKKNDSLLVEHMSKFSNESLQHRDDTHTVDKHFVHVLRTSAIKLVGGVH